MRLATLSEDFWELESGEARHAANPETFWIPTRRDRESLSEGQQAKLLFCLEGYEDDGSVATQVERMRVLVTEVGADGTYIGILQDQPFSYDPSSEFYLVAGAEVPFRAEHVIDITSRPWWKPRFSKPTATHTWPRQ